MEAKSPPRRTLLQKGLLALTSAWGLGAGARRAAAEEAPAAPITPSGSRTLTLHGRRRPSPSRLDAPSGGARTTSCGELLDGPDGAPIGEFQASGFCADTAFGPGPAAGLEFQTFRLSDGALFGVGAGSASAERSWAVLGGTGRFAGARGTYVEREVSAAPAGRGAVLFVLTLTA